MSVTTAVNVRSDGRHYGSDPPRTSEKMVQLPLGIQSFSAQGTVTGAGGGGHSTVSFLFNPSSDRTFQPYVILDFVSVEHSVADAGNAWVFQVLANWERAELLHRTLDVIKPIETESSVQFAQTDHSTHNLGRAILGTTGELRVRMAEINTAVTTINISGFISDLPMIGDTTRKA